MDWHSDLPPGTEEIFDMMAKALMLRLGGSIVVSRNEMQVAADTPCEIAIADDGSYHFRVEVH